MEISEGLHKDCRLEEFRQGHYKVWFPKNNTLLGIIRFWSEPGNLDPHVEIFEYKSDLNEYKYLEEITFGKNGTTILYPAALPRALWRAQDVLCRQHKEKLKE